MSHMAISRIDKEFLKFFSQLDESQKKSLLTMLKTLIKTTGASEHRISVEQYNSELEEAMEEIKRGDILSHEEVVKRSKGW